MPRSDASVELARRVEPRERELRRRRRPSPAELRRPCPGGRPSRSGAPSRPSDDRDRQRLQAVLQPHGHRNYAGTMKTGVPIVDVVEQPLGVRDVHPDAAVRGRVAERGRIGRAVDARRRAPTGPSSASRAGCPGPGGIGFAPFAHGESGGYHHGSFHLTTISKLAERRRVDRLAGRDREGPPRLHALVEVEVVRPATDDDHRAERRAGDVLRDVLVRKDDAGARGSGGARRGSPRTTAFGVEPLPRRRPSVMYGWRSRSRSFESTGSRSNRFAERRDQRGGRASRRCSRRAGSPCPGAANRARETAFFAYATAPSPAGVTSTWCAPTARTSGELKAARTTA